ncbi:MAG: hypothetical protein A3I61_14655 [Acidobacteria bacterium RIFCSPLOWO2_02_FULL_68_18]|nr:MAG: hypothetical protein A3I61_14655 [Acidobacteria bacterium RIFCSPLOWO2_02_FULL_68_18]OFW52211.1 MAG: hypothetical protein A3G77_08355 [Acidobacteria bacterium RIFCSPLOWO2_12_FULL_68_19]
MTRTSSSAFSSVRSAGAMSSGSDAVRCTEATGRGGHTTDLPKTAFIVPSIVFGLPWLKRRDIALLV